MERPTFFSLRVRLAVAFGLFVLGGSSVLIFSLQLAERAEELDRFSVTARANANFIQNARLPATPRTASALSLVHGFDVAFVAASETAPQLLVVSDPQERASLLQRAREKRGAPLRWNGFETILLPLADGTEVWFVRQADLGLLALLNEKTATALGAFWLLALGLAIALGRGIIRPLRSLAEHLPTIDRELSAPLPEAARGDEIGQLARAFLKTRAQLVEERLRREKSERLALLGRMATGLAHEIHNPVAAIRMHAQLVQSAPPGELAAAAHESLPLILGEAARIETLVNQWMFLARPEPPRTSRVELAPLVQHVVDVQRPVAQHAGVEVFVEVPPGLSVEADSRRLGQAVSNAVINAIQAMPDGGELRITSEVRDGSVKLMFRDRGTGFSAAAIEKHAELFFSEKEGGMGVGLSVTAEVLKAHRGSLQVENAPTGGAIVTFQLPLLP
jgi:signal transduction histidine kinase